MISFDGWSGTGKTTQALAVNRHYDLPIIVWDNRYVDWEPEITTLGNAVRTLANIVATLSERDDLFTIDCCLFGVLRYLAFERLSLRQDNTKLLTSICDELFRGLLGREPVCFYLYVPRSLADLRRMRRDYNVDLSASWDVDDLDGALESVVSEVSGQLSYFHVLDGSRSVEAISGEVFNILGDPRD